MKLNDGIYCYQWTNMWENNCNSYILKKNATTILIDPGLKRYVPALLISVEQDGIKQDDISLVINTHGHPDHLDGNAYFLERSIKVALSEEEGKFLQTTGKDFFRMFGLEQPSGQIDVSLTEGPFKHGDIELEVLLTPGTLRAPYASTGRSKKCSSPATWSSARASAGPISRGAAARQ